MEDHLFSALIQSQSLQPRPPMILRRQTFSSFEALLQLNRIAAIRVTDVVTKELDDGVSKHFYVIHVHHQSVKSRLPLQCGAKPTLQHVTESSAAADPDAVIERRFSDFERLRKALTDEVVHSHKSYCKLCDQFLFKLSFSISMPRVLSKILVNKPNDRRKLLQQFMVEMLHVLQQHHSSHGLGCRAVDSVPRLFHDFFFVP